MQPILKIEMAWLAVTLYVRLKVLKGMLVGAGKILLCEKLKAAKVAARRSVTISLMWFLAHLSILSNKWLTYLPKMQ